MAKDQPDISVADAIDRVLEVERQAAASIRTAETEAEALLQAARDERRRILDRARDRASRVHVRAQARLADDLARLETETRATVGRAAPHGDLAVQVIERLARRLACDDHGAS